MADQPRAETPEYWQPGDQRLLRFRRHGRVSMALPTTTVRDGPDATALYLRPGTAIKRRVLPSGAPIPRHLDYAERAQLPHVMGDGVWRTHHALVLVRPGEAHDVQLFWSAGWHFRGWYINLQAPVQRSALGFDTVDHVLDIVVAPDVSWAWKDEDEFTSAIAIGRFSVTEGRAIRREGARVARAVEARRWPFDGSLRAWRPDPGWPLPSIPLGWDADG